MDPVRVLAELSGLVVGKLVDDEERAAAKDPFGRAFLRLMQEGEPSPEAGWRRALAEGGVGSARAATVLKRLTRDLLHGITHAPSAEEAATEPEPAVAVDNVRPITDALQPTPGFELANDGRWRPAAPSEDDPLRGYRPRSPQLGSRYPES